MATPGITFQEELPVRETDHGLQPTFHQNTIFGTEQRVQRLLQPRSVSITVHVVQDTAKAVVTQHFDNTTSYYIRDGTYQFPLPYESTVVDFNCRIGTNKVLRGQVKPRETAQDDFNQAVRSGRTAGLVEQNSPEIFSTSIGNIPPGTKLEAELSYIFLLKQSSALGDNVLTMTIPTYIAPRYGTPQFLVRETGPQQDRDLSIDVNILTQNEITDVKCETHNVQVAQRGSQQHCQHWHDFIEGDESTLSRSRHVKLNCTGLDSDFMLRISTRSTPDAQKVQGTLETHPSFEGHSALMIEIPSKFMLQGQTSTDDGELIFLADRSGSMREKIPGLKSSLEFFIRGIPTSKRFNIWCFGSSHESLWPESQLYDDGTLASALSYVDSFSSNMGGTEILPALRAITRARQGQGNLDVIVLTDGQVWRPEHTVEFVRDTREESEGAIRFFSLGIGQAVSHQLVESIARTGGGYAEVIPEANQGGWEDRVVAVLSAALTGHIGPIRLEWGDEAIKKGRRSRAPPTLQTSPMDLSTLSPFVENRVFVLAEEKELRSYSNLNIKARCVDGSEVMVPVSISTLALKESTIHKFAARALLGDLERGESWVHHLPGVTQGSSQLQQLTQIEGQRLGCKWSLVSKWTSFVAVEEEVPEPEQVMLDVENQNAENIHEDDRSLLRGRGNRLPRARAARLSDRPRGNQPDENDDAPDTSSDESWDQVGTWSDERHDDHGDNNKDGRGGGGAGSSSGSTNPGGANPGGTNSGHTGSSGTGLDGRGSGGTRNFSNNFASHGSGVPTEPANGSGLASDTNAAGSRQQAAAAFVGQQSTYAQPAAGGSTFAAGSRFRRRTSAASAGGVIGGSSSMATSGSLFGGSTSTASPSSGFGEGQSTATAGGLFGGSTSATTPSSLFGGGNTTAANSRYGISPAFSYSPVARRWTSSAGKGTSGTPSGYPPADREFYRTSGKSLSSQGSVDYEKKRAQEMFAAKQAGEKRASPLLAPLEKNKKEQRTSNEMHAPSYKPPAPSALLSSPMSSTKAEDVKHAEAYVRRIVLFQQADGRFVFHTKERAIEVLGLEVYNIVDILSLEVALELAVTTAILGLLRTRLVRCVDLWSRVGEKAKSYIMSQADPNEVEKTYARITTACRLASQIKKLPFEEVANASTESTELERPQLEFAA